MMDFVGTRKAKNEHYWPTLPCDFSEPLGIEKLKSMPKLVLG
jgi:hypothetical protein